MKKITKEMMDTLWSAIDREGFDYCFTMYSGWEELKNTELETLIKNYQKAHKELEDKVNELCQANGVEQ